MDDYWRPGASYTSRVTPGVEPSRTTFRAGNQLSVFTSTIAGPAVRLPWVIHRLFYTIDVVPVALGILATQRPADHACYELGTLPALGVEAGWASPTPA